MRIIKIGCLSLLFLIVLSCATNRSQTIDSDLSREVWQHYLDNHPQKWQKYADRWFLKGKPNQTERANRNASYTSAMTMMEVKVPNFTKIRFNGNFQLQIFGSDQANSVYILGPNEAAGAAVIRVSNDTLCIDQRETNAPVESVIIRVGMHKLNELVQMGCGTVEGIWLNSNYLDITTTPTSGSRIYLSGNLKLRHINHQGQSLLNIFGVNSQDVDIQSNGNGEINLCGNVGIQSIIHHGNDNINIIGARSPRLDVIADGSGKIGIKGQVNLRELTARDCVQIYIDSVTSDNINVLMKDKTRVGLRGFANQLNVKAYNNSRFNGRYLCTHKAYVKAYDSAHINVNSASALGASAQEGSVYYFGPERNLTHFTSGNGIVLPLFDDSRSCHIYNRQYVMKLSEPRLLNPEFVGAG